MFKLLILFFYSQTSLAQVSSDFGGASGGAVRIGTSATSCSTTVKGATRYDTGDGNMYVCDGNNWRAAFADPCANSLPNNWNFTDLTGQALSTTVTSSIHQVTNITGCSVSIKVSGSSGSPQYRMCSDSSCSSVTQDWSSSQRTITNNQYIQLRVTTSSVASTTSLTSLTVGDRMESWSVTTSGDCTATEPVPGSFCSDGTIYLGRGPDGATKMYTTPCYAGRTYDGTSCTGSAINLPWSEGATVSAGYTENKSTGEANTSALAGLSNADSPYAAATYCQNLVLHGQSDWYLPAIHEASLILALYTLIPDNSSTSQRIWASTEQSATHAIYYVASAAFGGSNQPKTANSTYVRCVRKD